MSLSEEEQRILKEMEQRLFEYDRGFASRVSSGFERSHIHSSLLWPSSAFVVGFFILIFSFRASLLLATIGLMVMLLSAFMFERNYRATNKDTGNSGDLSFEDNNQHIRHKPIAEELSVIAHKVTHLWRKQS